MGGNVGVIIKKEDGEQIGMSRWTNVMPYFFKSINLYSGNTKVWFEEFSEEWLKMKADYEKNKDTGNYEFNMTSVYFPSNTLSPDEYGIIAVDLKNKKIYSSQDYCNIGKISLFNIWSRHDDNEENIEQIKEYLEKGLIKTLSYYSRLKNKSIDIDITSMSLEDIIVFLNESGDYRIEKLTHPLFKDIEKEELDFYSSSFPIHSDWQFVTYHDRSIGVLKVRQELENDGFVFSEKDNTSWKEYLSYNWYYEEEADLKEDKEFQEFQLLYQQIFKEPFALRKD